ncbi:DUF6760 family protein [Lyngbya sp. CCY1209]|uniref:DUF6760 family protein n=1 Tax=Lyngbya sp. CCY1209 TaxID=2886103 RepID=UPI002D20FE24|nr:DUF6760 family protein [Lyngbya sp. CCY1209]MEB3885550.1 hypothetical protein [Lyngbya sp. CCY1209]
MAGYPLEDLYREVAFIAFYFHWSRAEILDLDHRERQRWIGEIANLVRRELGE